MNKLKVLELFGGIGACSKAFEKLGIDYEIADYVEIDKYAVKSFNAMHNTNFEPQDICKWDKDMEVDLIMHGSPCQSFSIAGRQEGGDKDSGTKSSLMYETIRIVEKIKPKYVIWENVKNLLSKKHRHNFDDYLKTMEDLGYTNYYQLLNAKDYGIPQNRERVFTISIRNDYVLRGNFWRGIDDNDYEPYFVFPPKQELKLKLKDMLEDNVNKKYYLSEKLVNCFMSDGTGTYHRRKSFLQNINRKNQDIANSITTLAGNRPTDNFVGQLNNLRKLTPKECWRLMGFDDEDFEKAEKVNSNTQLYKQAGNSIVVNVLMAIFKELFTNLPN